MIRSYSIEDKVKVLGLLRSNTPEYFDPSEEADFEYYLDHEVEDYFVFEDDEEIIGAGGINYFPEERLARISWDMIHPLHHGKGIGKTLTQHRIGLLSRKDDVDAVVVRRSQLVHKFYVKAGFQLEKVVKDFWAKDYDLYQMKMTL